MERKKRLKVLRDNNAARRAVETNEQRENRLGTEGKQAALKCAGETGQERERRLRAMRELAAKRRATESSQEKELRLRARRKRAAVKRHSENRPETVETGRRNETRKAADNRRRNERAALFEAHRGEYLHNRGWANPENRGLHHEEWAQEEMAAFHRFEENLRHYHCVICKEAWPLSASRQQIFTCSRWKRDRKPCRLYSAENDMDPGSVPAELQGLSTEPLKGHVVNFLDQSCNFFSDTCCKFVQTGAVNFSDRCCKFVQTRAVIFFTPVL